MSPNGSDPMNSRAMQTKHLGEAEVKKIVGMMHVQPVQSTRAVLDAVPCLKTMIVTALVAVLLQRVWNM